MRNRNYPEGSIVEGYLADECLTFCSRYLNDNVQTKFNKLPRNLDGPIGNGMMTSLEHLEWEQITVMCCLIVNSSSHLSVRQYPYFLNVIGLRVTKIILG